MIRSYYRRSGGWFVTLPWWLWLWVFVFRLAVMAVVCVLWLIWTVLRLLVVGVSRLGELVAQKWKQRTPKSERRTSEPGKYRL